VSRVTLDKVKTAKELGIRNVIRLGYVSLFTDLSTEMILGVLPVNFIIGQLGATAAILGLIEGSAEAANNIFRILAGVLTDKIAKRKPIVIIGYGLSTVAKPLFAVATSWGQAFAVRVADRAGKGTRTTPRDALISDSIPKSQAGKGFGLHSSLDQVGAVLGPLLAFALLPIIGLRNLFWISFIPGTISLIILVFFVADSRGRTKRRSIFENAEAVLTQDFVLLLVVLALFSVGAYNFSFILLEAKSLGISADFIPLVYALLNFATVIIAFPVGILADKIGKLPVLLLSFLIFMCTSVAGVLLVEYWAYGLLIAVFYGGYLSISDTVQRAMVPDFSRQELKGTAYAFYYTTIGVGSFVANSVFGSLWTSFGSGVAFRFSIATSSIAVLALLLFAARRRILGKK
jgi:MFS family permease